MAAPLKNGNMPSRMRLILTSDDLRDMIAWSGESHPAIAARAGLKPWRHWLRISPQAFLGLSCVLLQPFEHDISWRILPKPPAPAVLTSM
jgi:hypothetical protein